MLEELAENVVVCDGGAAAGGDGGGRRRPEVEGGRRRGLRRHHDHRRETGEKQGKLAIWTRRDFPMRIDFVGMKKLKGEKGKTKKQ